MIFMVVMALTVKFCRPALRILEAMFIIMIAYSKHDDSNTEEEGSFIGESLQGVEEGRRGRNRNSGTKVARKATSSR